MVKLEFWQLAAALGGGALIGLAASIWLLALGQIAGISGIVAGVLPGDSSAGSARAQRAAFLAGLVGMGVAMKLVAPTVFGAELAVRWHHLAVFAVAGLLVGIGTRVGGGCTSGHGVCGLSRGSRRSIIATATFIGVGALTVYARRTMGWP